MAGAWLQYNRRQRSFVYGIIMQDLTIGIQVTQGESSEAIDAFVHAEQLGIDAAWMTLGGVRIDPTAVCVGAAQRTERIMIGTSIVPIFPRHPWALAQEAKVVAELAPGRFRLGIGPSHKESVESSWGLTFESPLRYMREYVELLDAALHRGGPIKHEGRYFRVEADWGEAVRLDIMISALRQHAFELAGECAAGGISWVSPQPHIERVAIPALESGSARAGRHPRAKVVMHAIACVHDDLTEARDAGLAQFAHYPSRPFYRNMFIEAGFPEAAEGKMSPAMADSILLAGDEQAVEQRLRTIAAAGIDEVLLSVVGAGNNRASSVERTLRFLGDVCQTN
jgi:alkanesulfonate monooxygenase SsuD/methylene tetrahydromethanopterin reductase-like flavin-dependent oxidoreductase (luciferase family)